MALYTTALASGSNGNCYYIGNDTEAVLVDAGIPCREIETRMKRLGLSMQSVKAVFISHEHSDHIQGLCTLAKRYNLAVYITMPTLRHGRLSLQGCAVQAFRCSQPVSIGKLVITPFSKAHDAADPHSFVVAGHGVTIGVFTDIGAPCARLVRHFGECHVAFLEANYDEGLLMQGSYPAFLKARIRGGRGHLSNTQALELFMRHRPAHMSHLFLSHLSRNNNCPKLVETLFSAHAGSTQIIVASRYHETALYKIEATGVASVASPHYAVAASQLEFTF